MKPSPSPNSPLPELEDEAAGEELVLHFHSMLTCFEKALLKSGYRTGGLRHARGQPDWEGFARRISPRFERMTDTTVIGSAAVLMGFSVRTLEDVGAHYPRDRRFYQSDILWMARLIRTAGRRLAHAETLPWRQPAGFLLLQSCVIIMLAWADCDEGVRRHWKDPCAMENEAPAPSFAM